SHVTSNLVRVLVMKFILYLFSVFMLFFFIFFFFQAEDGIRDDLVTGVQTCALPISASFGAGSQSLRWALLLLAPTGFWAAWHLRSEERRVGKECRSRWWPYH